MEWKESGMNGKWGISSLYRRGQVNQSSSLMHAFTCLSESAAESVLTSDAMHVALLVPSSWRTNWRPPVC